MPVKPPIILVLFLFISCVGIDEIFEPRPDDPDLSEIIVTGPSSVLVGGQIQLTAVYYDKDGIVRDTSVNWQSSNTSILSVSNSGLAAGLQAGQVVVNAFLDTLVSNDFLVNVVLDSSGLAEIRLSAEPSVTTIFPGDMIQFMAAGYNLSDEELPGLDFTWISSKPSVLSIDGNGKATALSKGTAFIRAEHEGTSSQPYRVVVKPRELTGTFVISPGSGSYNCQGTVRLSIQEGEELLLEFLNDFSLKDSPGPYAYLSNVNHSISGGVEIGLLPKGSNPITGPFSFEVPDGVDLQEYKYVVVYCKPFSIPFGTAELK